MPDTMDERQITEHYVKGWAQDVTGPDLPGMRRTIIPFGMYRVGHGDFSGVTWKTVTELKALVKSYCLTKS